MDNMETPWTLLWEGEKQVVQAHVKFQKIANCFFKCVCVFVCVPVCFNGKESPLNFVINKIIMYF